MHRWPDELAHLPSEQPLKVLPSRQFRTLDVSRPRLIDAATDQIQFPRAESPYVADREETTWYKILNPGYSQRLGREELFERDRHKEAVPGWHRCALACAESEEVNV